MGKSIRDYTEEELHDFIENQRAQAADFQSMANEKTSLANRAETELMLRASKNGN